MTRRARIIAFYLPQYHPIAENDQWWGLGFTEWTAVTRAKPLFPGHEQPRLPGELGFYDLRIPEVREAQAHLAREHGIEGFCYWHYWMGNGRRLLERPFEEVLRSGSPDLPFCLGWANHSWRGRFFGAGGHTLIQQEYPGVADYKAHFDCVLYAFRDERYIQVEGMPLFYIFRPQDIPDLPCVVDLWQSMARAAGLKGLHLVGRGLSAQEMRNSGLDGFTYCMGSHLSRIKAAAEANRIRRLIRKGLKRPNVFRYSDIIDSWSPEGLADLDGYPDLLPNWDNTPRLGHDGEVYQGSTPELFRLHVVDVMKKVVHKPFDRRIVFLKSWNEWAEGNYIEPDASHGRAYLEVLRSEVMV